MGDAFGSPNEQGIEVWYCASAYAACKVAGHCGWNTPTRKRRTQRLVPLCDRHGKSLVRPSDENMALLSMAVEIRFKLVSGSFSAVDDPGGLRYLAFLEF